MAGSKIKTKELELKKQIILEEAAKLIDKVGFKNAKMEDIAKKVGFSKGSLYSYFKDKEEIAMNIAKTHVQKFYNRIADLPSLQISAPQKLEIMKNAHMEFLKRSKNFMTIKPNYALMYKTHMEFIELKLKTFGILISILEQGKNENIFCKNLKSESAVRLLEAMFTGIIFLNSMIKNLKSEIIKDFDLEEMISFAMDFFYLGITNNNTEICK
ncbi:MAG: TetR/AcrR family transcriptional regulator [Candidatus Delongbacteria bacterium]|nr:TetR/AcrR family transcriptional regulator [Candidatus Delongbacteria bacterium]